MKTFSARETVWLQELDGIELAGFWRRAIAFGIDSALSGIALSILAVLLTLGYLGVRKLEGKPINVMDPSTLNSVIGDKAVVTVTPDGAPKPASEASDDTIHHGHVTYTSKIRPRSTTKRPLQAKRSISSPTLLCRSSTSASSCGRGTDAHPANG